MKVSRLGRFEVLKEIGQGAMGQVFLANDPKIERQVAIKTIMLPPGTSEQEAHETSQRFLREAQAAGKLLHPNIVTIFDVGEEGGVSFIAMEFIEGQTLERFTRGGSLLPLGRVLDLMAQAAGALDYAHQRKVVHRDIKPANLMVLNDGTLKVTDFGLAKNPSANLTQAGVLLGTPSYMSPEQIQGHEIDGRSDLFSLGVVLYELLTGLRPFEGESISTIIYKVLYEDPRPPAACNPVLPPDLNVVLARALAKDPARRYATGADLVTALQKALSDLPAEALARPLPGGARPGTAGAAPATLRRERGPGGRPVRPNGGKGGRGGALPVSSQPRATMLAHHPGKIAAVMLLGVLAVVLFPRLANRLDHSGRGGPDRPLPGGLNLSAAVIGAAPAVPVAPAGRQVVIQVATIPHGGTIYLDTILLAEPQIVLSSLDAQPHDIVARAGCRQATAEMTAADLESFNGPLVMEMQPRREEVTIASEPAGARIEIDGRNTGKITPASLPIDGCAERSLRLVKEGYRPWSASYTSEADFDAMKAILANVPLEPVPAGAVLVRRPGDYDVEIFAGNDRIGRAGQEIGLPEGRHTLTFRNDKVFLRQKLQVEVEGGRTATPLVTFPSLGSLTVQAQPSNCKVWVDGLYVDVTPVLNLPVVAGGHRVKVVFVPNGSTQEVSVAVDAGKDARVVVKF